MNSRVCAWLSWLVGLGACGVIFMVTQRGWLSLAAGLIVLVATRRLLPAATYHPTSFGATPSPPVYPALHRTPTRSSTSIEVVCRAVTSERQEWVSTKTGRLYDVLSPNGLADARPGDKGTVTFTAAGWRIEPPDAASLTGPRRSRSPS